VRNDLGPAIAELDSALAAITNHGSYDCRGRNNDAGAKTSEHGRGNAFDLGPIRLANGAVMDLTKRSTPQPFRQRLRDAACHRFNTVLGPGSDAYQRSRSANCPSASPKWRCPPGGFRDRSTDK
jgi:hypothetical protein